MFSILATACLFFAIVLLVILSVIDLRVRLLPNVYNAGLAVLGVGFHIFTQFQFLSPYDMAMGALIGAGLLWGVRLIANRIYNQDTLGLGDVKLMGAAGLWLGPEAVLTALIVGALVGVLHGVMMMVQGWMRAGKIEALSTFSVPAGPGFCVGAFAAGFAKFGPFIQSLSL